MAELKTNSNNPEKTGIACSSGNPWRCIYLANIHLLIPILIIVYFRMHLTSVICDDAFITMKSALNLAEGRGLMFNADQRIWLVTTPVWAYLLAMGRFFVSDIIMSAKMWGTIFEICFLVSVVQLGRILSGNRWVGMLLGVLIATNPVYIFTSFSGMEISLSLLAITLTFILIAREKYFWSLIAASFAVWVRFDNLLVLFVAIISVLMLTWKGKGKSVSEWLKMLAAPVLMIAAYFLFGYLCFGDWIPTSVQAKSIHGAALFTPEWWDGVKIVANEFRKVIVGESGGWFVAKTWLWIMVIPALIGLVRIFIHKNRASIPLVGFTALYALIFIGSGNFYAQFFPWYFVPILPGVFFLASDGIVWLVELVSGLSTRHRSGKPELPGSIINSAGGTVAVAIAIAWFFVMAAPIQKDGEHFQQASNLRERSYAATTVWLGNHLDEGGRIASLEIGVIGFFARPDIRILDLFGILRPREDRWVNAIDLVVRDRPEAVIIIQPFLLPRFMGVESREKYQAARLDYNWFDFEGLEVGLRKDLESPSMENDMDELNRIYETVDLNKEYTWHATPAHDDRSM
ncbi:MAG: hypothetical protein NTY09_06290 [bacterium]|nr:hypothetical protein [bacterium]